MTFSELVATLAQALDEIPDLPSGPGFPTPSPVLTATYDPTCREAMAPDQILIGLGHWLLGDHQVAHRGICLNNKGTAEQFGPAYRYATVTDLVLDPPEPLRQHWDRLTAGYRGPADLLRHFKLIVEDSGPDSYLALLCWLARCCGVDPGELREGPGKAWVQAVRHWETTGMAEDPSASWAALLSTLGHSYLPTAGAPPEDGARHPRDFSQGWREALRFTLALLSRGIDPNAVPPAWDLPGYVRARAFLDAEREEYLQSLSQALCMQLWVPLVGTGGAHRLLVDAYFAVETWPSGARKLFARADCEHTHLRQGFALMGLYRPGERGTGGDMTISVNPWTGVDLQALWLELERLETERWGGRRPRDRIRPIASYPEDEGWNEPWWDDRGRYTLLGAPKALPDWPAGSRLNWTDVLEAAWRCYSPARGLRVRDLLDQRNCLLTECQRASLRAEETGATKHLIAVRWLPDPARPQGVLLAPTMQRAMAALIARERTGAPLTLAELAETTDLTLIHLPGGLAVLHERGVFLFDDWRSDQLPLETLREEARRCVRLLAALRVAEDRLASHRQTHLLQDAARRPWKSIGALSDLAAQRTHLARAQYDNAPVDLRPAVRHFRAQLAAFWGIDKAAEELQTRLGQMEDAIRTASALRTQGLVQILSVYGLPFFIAGGIAQHLAPWLDKVADADKWPTHWAPLSKVGIYLGLAAGLILAVRLTQYLWTRAATRAPQQPWHSEP